MGQRWAEESLGGGGSLLSTFTQASVTSGGPQASQREYKHQKSKSGEHLGSCYV